MIKLYLSNIFRIFRKRKKLFVGVVVLIAVMLAAISGILEQTKRATEKNQKLVDNYGEQQSYFIKEALSDQVYYQYLEDEGNVQKMKQFLTLLYNSNEFKFYTQIEHQGIQILNDRIPDMFLMGYESGDHEWSVNEYEDKKIYSTKALYVSEQFFEEYKIKISEGRMFTGTDYWYQNGTTIPVMLGSDYKGYYNIGDEFSGYSYMDEIVTFKVVGFLQNGSFFYSYQNRDFVSADRYIIVPAVMFQNNTEEAGIMLLQETTGILISNYGYEKTSELFQEKRKEAGLERYDIFVQNPDIESVMKETVEVYTSMTQEVAYMFLVVLIIIVILSLLTITLIICNCIRDNLYVYGVLMLSGAAFEDIMIEVLLLLSFLYFTGDGIAVVIALILGSHCILQLQVFVAAFIIICFLASVVYIKRLDISGIIGGKE